MKALLSDLTMRTTILCVLALASAALVARQAGVFPALKTNASLGKQAAGYYLVPTNQMLKPWGEQSLISGRPVDLAFDSQKRVLAVLNWRGVWLMDGSTGMKIAEIASRSTSYTGIAYRPGDREIWASETTRNGPDGLMITELDAIGKPGKTSRLEFKGHPVPAGMAFSPDGKTAYVAFSRNNTLAVIDAAARTLTREVEIGVAPFGVAVSSDGARIYVTN